MRRGETLLVLRALGLGDFLTGLPALRALERAFPGLDRWLAAPETLRPLAEIAGWRLLPYSLVEGPLTVTAPVEVGVNLHGQGPQSHQALVPLAPQTFIAFNNAQVPISEGFPIYPEQEHEVRRWCRLLEEFEIRADPEHLDLAVPVDWPEGELSPLGAPADTLPGATVIHPGAASPARRWPPDRWAEIARARAEQGNAVWLTGTAAERNLCEQVKAGAGLPEGANLAGKTDLLMLARIVAAAGLALSADTGFAHLATAVGTPSVVLFGPVSPEIWGPPEGRPQHRAIWKGSLGDPHGNRPDAGLMRIAVAEVLAEIDAALSRIAS